MVSAFGVLTRADVVEIDQPFRVRVKYVEVTNDGRLRFPIYMGRA
jgi:hypothetical protein